jgi:hypothetical protein
VNETTPTAANGTGRVTMVAIASEDGTRPDFSLWGSPNLSSNVVVIAKPQIFDNVHVAIATDLVNGATMTDRPSGPIVTDLGSSGTVARTIFSWPLSGTPKNTFTKVIEFDPQGVARIQSGNSYDSSISSYIEIPLVPAHGTEVASTAAQMADQAAIQVDGVTGDVRIYRP